MGGSNKILPIFRSIWEIDYPTLNPPKIYPPTDYNLTDKYLIRNAILTFNLLIIIVKSLTWPDAE